MKIYDGNNIKIEEGSDGKDSSEHLYKVRPEDIHRQKVFQLRIIESDSSLSSTDEEPSQPDILINEQQNSNLSNIYQSQSELDEMQIKNYLKTP